MKNKAILLLVSILFSYANHAQIVYYQDVFYGGVTGFGASVGANSGTIWFNIDIEPLSIIKKAFLIAGADGQPAPLTIELNGNPVIVDSTSIVTTGFSSYPGSPSPSSINCIDITTFVDPNVLNYSLMIPLQNFSSMSAFNPFYVLVIYENNSLNKVAVDVVLNNLNSGPSVHYFLDNLLPMINSNHIGYSFLGRHICDTLTDGTFININGNYLGLVGGSDFISSNWSCTGVVGNFYYKNDIFFGMDDDTPDPFVSGTDGIANIQSFVNSYSQTMNIDYQYQSPSQIQNSQTNPVVANFLTYTTPCDTFSVSVPSDTTICRGESLQLNVTGGSQFEWLPATDLSCSTCPNPVFTGDSTQLYTVRIWNNDSCSVVRPVKIKVQSCVGLEEQFIEESFTIHPNPTSGLIQLESKEWKNQELVIEVFDLLGKQKHAESILFQQDYWMNLRLSPGTYLLKVTSPQNEIFTKRIVVE